MANLLVFLLYAVLYHSNTVSSNIISISENNSNKPEFMIRNIRRLQTDDISITCSLTDNLSRETIETIMINFIDTNQCVFDTVTQGQEYAIFIESTHHAIATVTFDNALIVSFTLPPTPTISNIITPITDAPTLEPTLEPIVSIFGGREPTLEPTMEPTQMPISLGFIV